jgi:hypothetical protein
LALQYFGRFRSEADKYQRRPWVVGQFELWQSRVAAPSKGQLLMERAGLDSTIEKDHINDCGEASRKGTKMSRLKCLAAACALFLSFGAASASTVTFDVSGTGILAGSTWSVDTATAVVQNANIEFSGYNFNTDDSSFFQRFYVIDSTNTYGFYLPDFFRTSFIGFAGGTFTDGTIGHGLDASIIDASSLTVTFTAETSATPLPAALPLFATGLGALGLLGWRRKRKAQAAA